MAATGSLSGAGARLALALATVCVAGFSGGEGAELAPGDVVTWETRETVRSLVPEALRPYTIDDFRDLEMTIVEHEDYPLHPKYVEATARYACQPQLGEDEQLHDYTAGQPFPHSEWAQEATGHACDFDPGDPQAGLKLAWNVNFRWMSGGLYFPHLAQSYWRAAGDNTWRIVQGSYRRTIFSPRADLMPQQAGLVPGTDLEWAELTEMVAPFDQRGVKYLVLRYRDSRAREDEAFSYVPTLRRVQRLSAEQKADTVQGTDFTMEDFFLFSGYVWDHEWRLVGEHEYLLAMDTERECFPLNLEGWRPGAEGALGGMEEFSSCRFGPYNALPFVGERWQRRTTFTLEQRPKNPDHPYSRKLLWYDKETYAPIAGLTYDREGKPQRLFWYLYDWSETSDRVEVRGDWLLLPVAAIVVNVQKNVSNLMLSFATTGDHLSAKAARRLYDMTQLKRWAR